MPFDRSFVNDNFSAKLLSTLDHVEYRRIETQEDFEDIARLRYKAYKTHGVLPVNATKLIDEIDFDRNAHVFGVYYDEQLVSTIRLHVVTPEHRVCQSILIFPEAVNEMLDAGMTLIDSARFAIAPEFAGELSAMPYLTVRLTPVAAIYFDADRVLQPIRPAHAAFYRRFFYAQPLVEPRRVPTYDFDLMLLASKTRELRSKMMKRFPAFQSEACERRMLFDRSNFETAPLTILPTARIAGRPQSPEMAYLG
ncbi:hypothetical protein CYG48_11230 [Neorhizobium sp. SOG26]|jgi:hypothetical protein|uniref:N-acyl amino acid synthase FeeM domain-containing protein n=1 Tax=Neorhizobium sp. SOG26 TaxID=2060726 RepID=UPI000E5731EC|nr:hypothetical protein [Neorhizobium sp. SOG26]AXV16218.1 hypothetical protein CYG48_11230 [Neorhizobium sp. SOG26]